MEIAIATVGIVATFSVMVTMKLYADYYKMQGYRELFQQEAVAQGVASYVCDPQTGEVEFKWREK